MRISHVWLILSKEIASRRVNTKQSDDFFCYFIVGHDCTRKKGFQGPTQKALREARQQKFHVVASSSCDPEEDAEKMMGRRDLKVLCSFQLYSINPLYAKLC